MRIQQPPVSGTIYCLEVFLALPELPSVYFHELHVSDELIICWSTCCKCIWHPRVCIEEPEEKPNSGGVNLGVAKLLEQQFEEKVSYLACKPYSSCARWRSIGKSIWQISTAPGVLGSSTSRTFGLVLKQATLQSSSLDKNGWIKRRNIARNATGNP